MKLVAKSDFYAHMRRQCIVETHFTDDVFTTKSMTKAVDASCTAAVSTSLPNGVLELDTVATDNLASLAYVTTPINLTAGVCAVFSAIAKFEDAGADVANLMIGLSSEVGLDQMLDNGAGIDADFSGAGFYSIDGSPRLGVFYSNGTADRVTNLLTKAASLANADVDASYTDGAGDPKYRLFEIEIKCKTTTKADVTYKIDGVAVYQLLDQTYTNNVDVKGLVFIKNGTAAAQKMSVDAVYQGATFDNVA